ADMDDDRALRRFLPCHAAPQQQAQHYPLRQEREREHDLIPGPHLDLLGLCWVNSTTTGATEGGAAGARSPSSHVVSREWKRTGIHPVGPFLAFATIRKQGTAPVRPSGSASPSR